MNTTTLKGDWNVAKGKLKQKFAELFCTKIRVNACRQYRATLTSGAEEVEALLQEELVIIDRLIEFSCPMERLRFLQQVRRSPRGLPG